MNNDFSVVVHNLGGATVLAVSGELDLRTSPELEQRLAAAFDSGAELVILDLRQIEFMDSTGLRVLLGAHQRANESGRRFALGARRRPGRAGADADGRTRPADGGRLLPRTS